MRTFGNLTVATYNITESVPSGWNLSSANCTGGVFTSISSGVSVQLNSGDTVTCTFNNQAIVTPTGTIAITPGTFDFGSLIAGSGAVTQNFTLQNTGTGDLTITNVAVSGGNGLFAVPPFGGNVVLTSGQTTTVTVTFDPTTVGSYSASLNINHNGSNGPAASVTLDGEVTLAPVGMLGVTPSPHDFGSLTAGSSSVTQNFTLQNTGTGDLTISNIAISGGNGLFIAPPFGGNVVLTSGQTSTFTVTFDPTTVGTYSASLIVTHNGSNGPTSSVTLDGEVTPAPTAALSLTPLTRNYGLLTEGTGAITKSFTLENTGTANLTITNIAISGGNSLFTMSPLSLPITLVAGQTTTIAVAFNPTVVGVYSASLNVTHNGTNGPVSSATLQGEVTAAPTATLAITPSLINFGSFFEGDAAVSQNFTLENTGTADLTISAISINNGGGLFTTPSLTANLILNGGQTTTIIVTLDPAVVGNYLASLDITHDGTNGPVSSATLQGVVAPTPVGTLSLSPTSYDFGLVDLGSGIVSQIITLENTGTADLTVTGVAINGGNGLFTTPPIGGAIVIPSGGQATIQIAFDPTIAGLHSATLEIAHDGGNGPTSSLILQGQVNDPTVANLIVSTSLVNFGQINVGTTSAPQIITLTNSGGIGAPPINISNISLNGLDSAFFNHTFTSGLTLMPGAAVSINPITAGVTMSGNVSFAPITTGLKSAQLTITHDGANGPTTSVVLQGEGVNPTTAPVVVASNPTIAVADPFITKTAYPPFALPGELVTFTFTINNPGAVPANDIIAIDPMPTEVEILSATAPSGNVTVSGQQVSYQKDILQPGESVTVTIETRIRASVSVPFIITNEACMPAANQPAPRCSSANVLSISVLPQTGQTPQWALLLQRVIIVMSALAFVVFLRWSLEYITRR
jgi:uncharacterized repeat protein (TIGR01451 family)